MSWTKKGRKTDEGYKRKKAENKEIEKKDGRKKEKSEKIFGLFIYLVRSQTAHYYLFTAERKGIKRNTWRSQTLPRQRCQ